MSDRHSGEAHSAEVTVEVEVRYLAEHSEPRNDCYAFAYTMTIQNCGEETVQLLRRHWIITDGDGNVQEVEGEGVVGLQPVIEPGQLFRYTSGTVVGTTVGSMEGSYQLRSEGHGIFRIPIPGFALVAPGSLH